MTQSQKYASLGFSGQHMKFPIDRLFGMISGAPNSGKSTLFQSNPDAFIFNLDVSSTVSPNPVACIWPGISPEGQACDVDGSQFKLTWKSVIDKYRQLMDLAGSKSPRPSIVVIDSLGAIINLAKENVMKEWQKDSWRELDGRAGWDTVYDGILRLAFSLRNAGYGVFFSCHIINSVIQLGDDRWVEKNQLSITSGFWKRFYQYIEFSAVIHPETSFIERKEPDTTKTVQGREIRIPGKSVQEKVQQRVLTTTDDAYEGITKSRVEIERLVIPRSDSWQALADAYNS